MALSKLLLDNITLDDIKTQPGVYIFLDAKSKPIYVGKAKNLKARLSSYFNSGNKTIKTATMLSHARSLKTIVTTNEVEAFLLEANLIKTEQPKYNILLKDSKSYPYVKLTADEYPRLIYTRQLKDDGADYYGPFVNAGDIKLLLELLQRSFPLRTCNDTLFNEHKFCLKYQIKQCLAPCVEYISHQDYSALISSVRSFFKGDTAAVRQTMVELMHSYAKELKFEQASDIRDRVNSLDRLFSKQAVVNVGDLRSIDVFYKHTIDNIIGITQLFIRSGKLLGASTRFFTDEVEELLEQFVMQYYNNTRQFSELVYLIGDEYSESMEKALSELAGKRITIRKKGLKGLAELASDNAKKETELYLKRVGNKSDLLSRLATILGVEKKIRRVECIDISHLAGDHTVGVSVVSVDGEFDKSTYRKYKIKSAKNDDFLSMYELFTRKFENIDEGSEERSDLYIIDGGIGQLAVVERILIETNREANIISISKSRSERPNKFDGEYTIEEIHLIGRKNPLKFKRNDSLLHFIQSMRDEAHRFAITYSRRLAVKGLLSSPLLTVEGVGKTRLKKLLEAIPDIHNRKDISVEEIIAKAHLPHDTAERIINHLHEEKK